MPKQSKVVLRLKMGFLHPSIILQPVRLNLQKSYLSEAQALDLVKKKTEKYNAAKDKGCKKDNQVKKAEKEVRTQISELADTIDELGKSIGGPAGEIISLMGSIGSFTMTAMAGG